MRKRKKKKNALEASNGNTSGDEGTNNVTTDEATGPSEEAEQGMTDRDDKDFTPDEITEEESVGTSGYEPEDGASAPATARMELQQDPEEASELTGHELDLDKVPESIREDYFTPVASSAESGESDSSHSENTAALDVEKDVDEFNDLHEAKTGTVQLVLGTWILSRVLHNNLQLALSRNPKKDAYYKSFVTHGRLNVTSGTVNRWVRAAAVIQELQKAGLDTSLLTYSRAYEISKLRNSAARLRIAREVIDNDLTVKATAEFVKAETEASRPDDSADEELIREKAKRIMEELEKDLETLMENEDLNSVLLDETRLRLEFNFDELSTIFNKAKKEHKQKLLEKAKVEERNESVQKSINFLDEIMNNIRKNPEAASQSQG